jgi:hypothetical protein
LEQNSAVLLTIALDTSDSDHIGQEKIRSRSASANEEPCALKEVQHISRIEVRSRPRKDESGAEIRYSWSTAPPSKARAEYLKSEEALDKASKGNSEDDFPRNTMEGRAISIPIGIELKQLSFDRSPESKPTVHK